MALPETTGQYPLIGMQKVSHISGERIKKYFQLEQLHMIL